MTKIILRKDKGKFVLDFPVLFSAFMLFSALWLWRSIRMENVYKKKCQMLTCTYSGLIRQSVFFPQHWPALGELLPESQHINLSASPLPLPFTLP